MKIQELEEKVWAQDGIRIVVRGKSDKSVNDYKHAKASQNNWRITEFIDKRIKPLINDLEVIVIEGNGEQPHGGTLLSSIRKSYNK